MASLIHVGYRNPYRLIRLLFPIELARLRLHSKPIGSFDEAKEALNTLRTDPGNDVKLQIYALYKQATLGDCRDRKPNLLNFVAVGKWQAWNSLSSMTKVSRLSFTFLTPLFIKSALGFTKVKFAFRNTSLPWNGRGMSHGLVWILPHH
ncbi:unnamed protein product [Echinostoma caproni]|uniref:ACB domain-containing protein n=1 Tax=Echinostoma caproni TaxID=27848 RepID=A0A183BFY6_9TREM|nr:unnamed protein product [Echinostoma caproni]